MFSVVPNGFSKSSQKEFFWKTIFFIFFVLITGLALRFSFTFISAIIGGIIGGSLVANHPQILCVINENFITVYLYNCFSTKIIDKKIFNLDNIVITDISAHKSTHLISLLIENQPYNILFSEKTLGFKDQAMNVRSLLLSFQKYEH